MDHPCSATKIPALQVLLDAFRFQDTIINNRGQHTSPTLTSNKKKSSHKYECDDCLKPYCWNQCMLEVHNKDCSCNPSSFTRHTNNSLPAKCYSPSRDSCDWYRNFLEQRYSSEATTNAYAIRYAEKFCKLYDYRYTLLSADGQKWVDVVRKCLKLALVPLLRP